MNHALRSRSVSSRAHRVARPRARRASGTTAALLIVLCGVLCGAWFFAPVVCAQSRTQDGGGSSVADGIAAIVNAEIITFSELQTEMADETFRLKARYEGNELTAHLVQKQYEILNRMIERKLQLQEAKAKKITIGDGELEKSWEQLHQNSTALPASLPKSKEVFREELMVRRLIDLEVRRSLVVSPQEIRAHYKEELQQFTSPRQYHIRQILLLPKPGESVQTVKTRAEVIVNQLNEGESFQKLAELFSSGPESLLGGDLGFVTKAELLPPLSAALNQLNPGEVSPLIETEIGIHILQLEEIQEGTPQPFETVRNAIGNRLYQKKNLQALEAWLSSLKNKAYIEIRF